MKKWADGVIEDEGMALGGKTGRVKAHSTHIYYNMLVHFVKENISGLDAAGYGSCPLEEGWRDKLAPTRGEREVDGVNGRGHF
jgi:hypothetical protein